MRTLISLFLFLPVLVAQEPKLKVATQTEVKAAFLKLLDRPKIEPDVKAEKPIDRDGLHEEQLTFASEKKVDGTIERVPVLVVRPPLEIGIAQRRSAVILLHGTGGNKESQRGWCVEFAKLGFVAVAIDARYHGARSGGKKGSEAYAAAIVKAWQAKGTHEHPWFYDTCWDLWRLVDVLIARPDVDAKRIGMIGTSMGGIQTYLAASIDDRVKLAAPLIAAQSFRWSLENDKWQGRAKTIQSVHELAAKDLGESKVNQRVCKELWAKIVPRVTDDFDCPSMIRLFAGRPLFLANGELDPNCPVEGAKLAFASAELAFKTAKAEKMLEIHLAKGVAHKVTDEQHKACTNFVVKWLGDK